jgi:hypothetical protein
MRKLLSLLLVLSFLMNIVMLYFLIVLQQRVDFYGESLTNLMRADFSSVLREIDD